MPPPVIITVPLAGWVTESTDFGPPSTSVSLASTSTAVARSVLGDRRGVVDRDRRVVDAGHVTVTVACRRR